MPYSSKAQQRFMHAVHPGIAKRWDRETKRTKGGFKGLPPKKGSQSARSTRAKTAAKRRRR